MMPRFMIILDRLTPLRWAVLDGQANIIRSRWEKLDDARLDARAREVFEGLGCEIKEWAL